VRKPIVKPIENDQFSFQLQLQIAKFTNLETPKS